MISRLIKNGKILEGNKLVEKNIIIEDNKIKDITDDIVAVDEVIDAEGNIILPGIIDGHVHFREPGLTHKEDFLTGSKAAAAGGITTILDMPNTKPATTTLKLLEEKRELAKKSLVNYGFHFGATMDNLQEIKEVKKIASVKIYMDETTGDLKIDNDEVLQRIFNNTKRVAVHAENENVLKAINFLKNSTNKKILLYLCHISQESEIKVIKRNKSARIFAEATPHHLFLTDKDDKDAFTKMKPTLKTKQDQDALWQAISKDVINTIGSDHAPHTIEEKNSNVVYGVPGVETLLPLLLNAVNKKRLKLGQLVRLCCENPAKIFKLKNKGFLKEGYDADLVIIDMNKEKTVKNEELLTKCKWSPFNGWKLKGWPLKTIVNGNLIYDNGLLNEVKAKEVEYYE